MAAHWGGAVRLYLDVQSGRNLAIHYHDMPQNFKDCIRLMREEISEGYLEEMSREASMKPIKEVRRGGRRG